MAKVSDISLDTSSTWPLLSSKGDDGQRESTNKVPDAAYKVASHMLFGCKVSMRCTVLAAPMSCVLNVVLWSLEGKAAAHRTSAVDARYRMRQELARLLPYVNMHRAVF